MLTAWGSPSSWPTTTSSSVRVCARCSRWSPISRSSASPATTTSCSPARPRPRRRCSSPTSACRRASSRRASTRPRSCAAAIPGTGIVVLSQYDDPEYAVALLSDGAAGYAYLLKDRIAEGNQLARTVREVAAGGSRARSRRSSRRSSRRCRARGGLSAEQERLLKYVAEGRPIKAIARRGADDPGRDRAGGRAAVHHAVRGSQDRGIRRAAPAPAPAPGHRRPGGAGRDAEPPPPDRRGRQGPRRRRQDRRDRGAHGHRADVRRPRLLGHRRAVGPERARRPAQRAPRRDEPGDPRPRRHRHAVHRRRGDGLLRRAGAADAPRRSTRSTPRWRCSRPSATSTPSGTSAACPAFGLGIGISTGPVAAAMLGSEERLEYTLVGDTVNLAQRLQDLARPGRLRRRRRVDARRARLRPRPRGHGRAAREGAPDARPHVPHRRHRLDQLRRQPP